MSRHTSLHADCLVVGSGAGGAVTAAVLAQAGCDVLIIEEGPPVPPHTVPHSPFAVQELYRNGGLSPVLGRPNVAFVEGCCVGGSTEVNAGFWHRTPPDVIERWAREWHIQGLGSEPFDSLLDEVEAMVGIGAGPPRCHPDPASDILANGARALGWRSDEIPRAVWSADAEGESAPGARRSMSQTVLPRALAHGARLLSQCKAQRLLFQGRRACGVVAQRRASDGSLATVRIRARQVFVCGGALQTPTLLRSSGVRRNVGDTLRLHLMLKLAAVFDHALEPRSAVLPVCQIKQNGPDETLGGSVSTPGFLAITLGDDWERTRDALREWRHMALYYTLCRASACATVRPFPLTGETFARYTVTDEDRRHLTEGFLHLCEVMFAAGARRVFAGLRGWAPLDSVEACRARLSRTLAARDLSLSSVHAFSSCPMGEVSKAAVDSWGRVHGFEGLHVADASILPTSPSVNPQATIMAMCLRNARQFVGQG